MKKIAKRISSLLLSGCLLAGTMGMVCGAETAGELPAWPKDKPLKVLAIGNSFSEDAMRWMYDIAADCGAEDVIFANLYIGGCSLQRHVDNAKNNTRAYDYQKISEESGGQWTHTGEGANGSTMAEGLQDEDWDYITIQQVSGYSGVPDSFNENGVDYVDYMVDYIRQYNPDAKIGYHMTWAYQQDSNHGDFPKYDKDQMTMYNAILQTVQETVVAKHPEIEYVIPAGTTIQNLRTSFLGDTLTRDGYHMSYNLGRYAVGLTWILKLTGWSIDDVAFTPSSTEVPASYLPMIKESVKAAVAHPYEITRSSYLSGPFYNDTREMEELDLKTGATKFSYWQSDHSGRFNRPVTEEANSNQFVATRQFTKAEIPVGSIIELDEGYQYRPDGWVDPAKRNPNRPGTVTTARVVVDDAWWGDFTVRGFNVAKAGNPALSDAEAEDILSHIRIYVPVFDMAGYRLLDLKAGATEAAYWNTGDQNNHSQLTIGADNSPYYVATGLLTQADMPVGSIIEVDEGWQYRPERWITFGEQQQNRPDNVKTSRVIVDEGWWGDYTVRAFNISATTGDTNLTGRLEEALTHFRIYVPDNAAPSYTEELDLKTGATRFGYWQSDSADRFNRPVTEDGNSNQFVATRQFTKAEIPVGSVILLDEGYQYRPDGWVDPEKKNDHRPNNVTTGWVIVDDNWWKDFTVRAFNVAKKGNPALTEEEADDILNHIHIYTPVFDMDGYTQMELKDGATEAAYWNSGDQNNHSVLTTEADNSKNFVATATMTREQLPVGSVIEVDAGWQYRPERWQTFGERQTGRPDNTIAQRVVVDESWWDGYTVRAFNISVADPELAGGSDLTGRLEEALSHFRIYLPDTRSDQNLITSIAIPALPATGCVFGDNEIRLTLSESWDLTSVSPQITVSEGATISPDPSIPQDFSKPVQYTVTAENGDSRVYTISIQMPIADGNEILSFRLAGCDGIIDGEVITVYVPSDVDLHSIAPEITASHKATISPDPTIPQDFTSRVRYTVTAENGSERSYLVSVYRQPADSTLKDAKAAATQALQALDTSNDTHADDILSAVKKAVDNPNVIIEWNDAFTLTPATIEAEGRIQGSLALSYAGDSVTVELDLAIAKLNDPDMIVSGDLDKDGKVTIADVMEACKVLARKSAEIKPTADEIDRGDLDGDDDVTIADVMEICKLLARKG